MPTPYGSCGGMAFGVEELRVLRRALALAVRPSPASAEDVKDCLRLAGSLDEAAREGARLRAFLVADLARYRAALPGTAAAYLALLGEALGAGHRPGPDDLAALGALRGNPLAATLLARCEPWPGDPRHEPRVGDERRVRPRPAAVGACPAPRTTPPDHTPAPAPAAVRPPRAVPASAAVRPPRAAPEQSAAPAASVASASSAAPATRPAPPPPGVPASRARLQALPGGLATGPATGLRTPADRPTRESADRPAKDKPAAEPAGEPGAKPAAPGTAPKPARPVPTPGEVFPRKKPARPPAEQPPADPPRQLAA
ncbi:MAG TPA: hypothetical protein VFP69_19170, partial [Streptomyces sp.]|nr:hypothetical protein [Streptomyces sp.]